MQLTPEQAVFSCPSSSGTPQLRRRPAAKSNHSRRCRRRDGTRNVPAPSRPLGRCRSSDRAHRAQPRLPLAFSVIHHMSRYDQPGSSSCPDLANASLLPPPAMSLVTWAGKICSPCHLPSFRISSPKRAMSIHYPAPQTHSSARRSPAGRVSFLLPYHATGDARSAIASRIAAIVIDPRVDHDGRTVAAK